jgi:hypothetical protein
MSSMSIAQLKAAYIKAYGKFSRANATWFKTLNALKASRISAKALDQFQWEVWFGKPAKAPKTPGKRKGDPRRP